MIDLSPLAELSAELQIRIAHTAKEAEAFDRTVRECREILQRSTRLIPRHRFSGHVLSATSSVRTVQSRNGVLYAALAVCLLSEYGDASVVLHARRAAAVFGHCSSWDTPAVLPIVRANVLFGALRDALTSWPGICDLLLIEGTGAGLPMQSASNHRSDIAITQAVDDFSLRHQAFWTAFAQLAADGQAPPIAWYWPQPVLSPNFWASTVVGGAPKGSQASITHAQLDRLASGVIYDAFPAMRRTPLTASESWWVPKSSAPQGQPTYTTLVRFEAEASPAQLDMYLSDSGGRNIADDEWGDRLCGHIGSMLEGVPGQLPHPLKQTRALCTIPPSMLEFYRQQVDRRLGGHNP